MAGRPRSGRAYAWRTSKGRSRMLEVDGRFFVLLMSNGILIGLMYSLIALGFVLVYKATDAINFAQGEFVMIAGFVVAVCLVAYGAPLWLAVSAGLLGMVGFGFGLERVMLRRLIGRPIIAVVMATIGLAAILRGVGPLTWGAGGWAVGVAPPTAWCSGAPPGGPSARSSGRRWAPPPSCAGGPRSGGGGRKSRGRSRPATSLSSSPPCSPRR